MKLKHRISAALTALALIFTLTDSSALGGIFSAAARAFASFSDIEFDTNDTNGISQFCADAPKANELFYYYDLSDINQITSLGRNGYFSDFTMTWYDSNGDKVQSDKAGYNKEYSMKMVFKKNLNKVFPEVINIVYQDSEKKVCTVPTVIDDEQNTITATFYFSATIKPEPVSAVFEDGQYIQFVNHVSGMKYLCHTTKKSIIDSLPQTALIYSQDDEVTTTADIIWATKSGLGENDYTFEKT
ncbi:MAG: hypothetical protein ACI4WS_08605, partial [Oscillospiraceae bacterium]